MADEGLDCSFGHFPGKLLRRVEELLLENPLLPSRRGIEGDYCNPVGQIRLSYCGVGSQTRRIIDREDPDDIRMSL